MRNFIFRFIIRVKIDMIRVIYVHIYLKTLFDERMLFMWMTILGIILLGLILLNIGYTIFDHE